MLPCLIRSAALASVLALGALPQQVLAQDEPLRIGFLTVRTGALAAGGKQMEEGIQLFLKERNNTLAGRKVELIIADTGGTPPQAKTKTQELVEKNQVHVIIGPLATFEALAIDDYIKQAQVPLITPTSAAQKDLAQQKLNDYVIHAVGTAAQPMHVLGEFAAKKLGIKRIATVADDFTYGHEGAAGFQRAFEDGGGKVVQKLWPPLNVADYGSYVGQIKPNVDGVYAGFAGINGLRFLKQYSEYGLGKIAGLRQSRPASTKACCATWATRRSACTRRAGIRRRSTRRRTSASSRRSSANTRRCPGFYTVGTYVAGMYARGGARRRSRASFEDKAAFVRRCARCASTRARWARSASTSTASRSSTSTCARSSARTASW